MLSSYSISEEVTKAIYIESKHKVLIGSLNNWSWNDQESSTLNGKHDDTKGLVLIKKFEKGKTQIIGSEWIFDKSVNELKKRLLEKYFEPGIDGWMCIERSESKEIRIEEMISFFPVKKNQKSIDKRREKCIHFDNGDVIIIGREIVDACPTIRKIYNSITIEAIFHDNLTYFDFKSHSKRLFEKHQLGSSFTISLNLSSNKLEIMKEIHSNLKIPGIEIYNIQILDKNYKPLHSKDFYLSNILINNKLYFDILEYNTLDEDLYYQTFIKFTKDFIPIQRLTIQIDKNRAIEKILEKLDKNYEFFLYNYQQKAVLKILNFDEEINEINPGIILGLREGAEIIGKKESVRANLENFRISRVLCWWRH